MIMKKRPLPTNLVAFQSNTTCAEGGDRVLLFKHWHEYRMAIGLLGWFSIELLPFKSRIVGLIWHAGCFKVYLKIKNSPLLDGIG